MQKEIWYSDIVDLKFNIELVDDQVYFNQYGYKYKIITKQLTECIYIDWHQETRKCTLVIIDDPKKGNIIAQAPINNLHDLKRLVR